MVQEHPKGLAVLLDTLHPLGCNLNDLNWIFETVGFGIENYPFRLALHRKISLSGIRSYCKVRAYQGAVRRNRSQAPINGP